jgi:hypothetical protein
MVGSTVDVSLHRLNEQPVEAADSLDDAFERERGREYDRDLGLSRGMEQREVVWGRERWTVDGGCRRCSRRLCSPAAGQARG